ncbi:MAG: oligopeptide/dipeptide ABC transporter ATP-binding protein [Thermodesulfobacteriota bacterium]
MAVDDLVKVRNLKKYFPVTEGLLLMKQTATVKAVDGISFGIMKGETLGLVGESGCGKTTLANMILLLERATEGNIQFESKEISGLKGNDLREYKAKVQAVFQDPYSSLNPRLRIRNILKEPMIANGRLTTAQKTQRIAEVLNLVGLQERDAGLYPHEFSGGQRQRIAIARALCSDPELIILDEPVSALDVSIRSQIMNLLKRLQRDLNLTYLLIAHDLGVVKHMSDWVAVMYLGKIVELAKEELLYSHPLHPYTKALISSAVIIRSDGMKEKNKLRGDIPSPLAIPIGCRLHTRCPEAMNLCFQEEPNFKELESNHWVSCHHY